MLEALKVKVAQSYLTLQSAWDSPGQNTGVGSLSLLQEIFPTQGLHPGLSNCRWILYQPSALQVLPASDLQADRTNPGIRKTESRCWCRRVTWDGLSSQACPEATGTQTTPFCSALGHPSSLGRPIACLSDPRTSPRSPGKYRAI